MSDLLSFKKTLKKHFYWVHNVCVLKKRLKKRFYFVHYAFVSNKRSQNVRIMTAKFSP